VFTGLIAERGSVSAHEQDGAGATLTISAALASQLREGDSVAVNGVCLTATHVGDQSFQAEAMLETLERSSLGQLRPGAHVNLELPLRLSDRLGGHVVLGHVDGVGEVRASHESGEIEVTIDEALSRYVVEKGSIALDGVSLELAPGEVLGLVGPNGSGKTTCINVISGLYPPDGGRVLFDGVSIAGMRAHLLARRGINRTFQSPKPFLSLTVRENVQIAATYGHGARAAVDLPGLLAALELDQVADRPAGDLNSAQQKTLDLARALATAPRLLLVDELAAGLNHAELARMAIRLRALARDGMALLVVEHLMGFIDQVTDRVIVLNAGREIFEGTLRSATHDKEVIRVFLGGAHG